MNLSFLFGKLRKHELEMNKIVEQEFDEKNNKGMTLKTITQQEESTVEE